MQKNGLEIFILFVLTFVPASFCEEVPKADLDFGAFAGTDLHLRGRDLISRRIEVNQGAVGIRHTLIFRDLFSMSIGAYKYSSDNAVVWLESSDMNRSQRSSGPNQQVPVKYKAIVYLQGKVTTKKTRGTELAEPNQRVIEKGQVMVVWFDVSGQVFVTADSRDDVTDPRELELYATAYSAVVSAGEEGPGAEQAIEAEAPVVKEPEQKKLSLVAADEPKESQEAIREKKLRFIKYPINLSPAGKTALKVQWDDKEKIGTVVGRFYLWRKLEEKGAVWLLELQADSAVIFLSEEPPSTTTATGGIENIPAKAVYLAGNVVMTEGQRTIRADEIYYDFETKKALAINAVMRNFDAAEGIPIYVRAAKIRQLSETQFAADNITMTTSEFCKPQISLNASSVIITDTTTIDQELGEVTKESYDAKMHDVTVEAYDTTLFYWPYMHTNLQRPDLPIKSISTGHDSTWGTMLETRWYLARLLGLEEPDGTESTLALDYYGKRGFGAGVEVEYTGSHYFGRILGYIIHDNGKDRLGRIFTRKDIEPPRELRGRFRWQHRQFLPYNWQLTTEVSYASDRNFIESFYRSEYNVGKEQETLIHLKRIEDNWGLSFLGKVRINDFVDKLEELPTAEFHWTGQSFFDDKLTFYSDSQISRFRQRYAEAVRTPGPQTFYTFAATRNEVDMPISVGKARVVPFTALTLAYEDGFGFYRELGGNIVSGKDDVWLSDAGIRASLQPYWKVFPDVNSQLWDLNQLRHIIQPYLVAVAYGRTDSIVEQHNTVNLGISQRLQTKRGPKHNQRTVDWMRLDMDVTWVANSGSAKSGPDRFLWSKPFIPLINTFTSRGIGVPQQDRRGTVLFGPRRNYFSLDYCWRLSDTTNVLSDMYYDMQSGVVEQADVGFSHMRWPNLSYYVGSRYLKRINNGYGEEGSNAFTFAVTYVLDPRYTVVFSQQIDFDYGKTIRSDLALIRHYHRIFWGIIYSADESLDEHAITFALWPQGVSDLSIGERRYIGIGGSAGY
jgi:hypothetical protein